MHNQSYNQVYLTNHGSINLMMIIDEYRETYINYYKEIYPEYEEIFADFIPKNIEPKPILAKSSPNKKINEYLRSKHVIPDLRLHNKNLYEDLVESMILSPDFIYKNIYIFLDYGIPRLLEKYVYVDIERTRANTFPGKISNLKSIRKRLYRFFRLYWSIPQLFEYRLQIMIAFDSFDMFRSYFLYMSKEIRSRINFYYDPIVRYINGRRNIPEEVYTRSEPCMTTRGCDLSMFIQKKTQFELSQNSIMYGSLQIYEYVKTRSLIKIDPTYKNTIWPEFPDFINKELYIIYHEFHRHWLVYFNMFTDIEYHLDLIKNGIYTFVEDYLTNDCFFKVIEYIIENNSYISNLCDRHLIGPKNYPIIHRMFLHTNMFSICFRISENKNEILKFLTYNDSLIYVHESCKNIIMAIINSIPHKYKLEFLKQLKTRFYALSAEVGTENKSGSGTASKNAGSGSGLESEDRSREEIHMFNSWIVKKYNDYKEL